MVKKVILLVIALFIMGHFVEAGTLGDLLSDFRYRIGEPDSSESAISDSAIMRFLDQAQNKIVDFGGFLQKRTDITFSDDSLQYPLPSDFKRCSMVVVHDGDQWQTVVNNPGFTKDADKYQYFIWWENENQAEIYLKGSFFYPGLTVRIAYLATAPNMTSLTDTCYVPEERYVYIVEEAISYYEQSIRDHAVYQMLNNVVRQDMGIGKMVEGRK